MTSAPLVIAAGLEPASIQELALAIAFRPELWVWIDADPRSQLDKNAISGRRAIAIFDPEFLHSLPFDPSGDEVPFLLPHLGFLRIDSGQGIPRIKTLYIPKPCSATNMQRIIEEAERRASCAACISEQAAAVAAHFPGLLARKKQPYSGEPSASLLARFSKIFQIRQSPFEATKAAPMLHTCGA
jgi:hypothetical protein